jgi:hypothetical protein
VALLLILIISFAGRLLLSPLGFHVDILSNAEWGQWIYKNGFLGFYNNTIWIYSWPTQPPLISLIYGFDNWLYIFLLELFRSTGNAIVLYHLAPGHMVWFFEFIKWFDTTKTSTEAVFSTGYLASVKILPILADLGISVVIYLVAKRIKDIKYPFLWSAIYLLSPFSWYLSALWGQYDQISFLPLLLAVILESKNKLSWLTPFLVLLAICIKPTALILVPFFIYIYFKNKPKVISVAVSFALCLLFLFITTRIFTEKNLFDFVVNDLYRIIFAKAAPRLSGNSFNFWRLLQGFAAHETDSKFFFIPAYIWSLIFYIALNLAAFGIYIKGNLKSTFSAMFLASAGSWLFMTNMLERYFFIGIVSGLLLCLYNKKLFKYWIALSLIFWINLFSQWWFPEFLSPLKIIILWQNELITKFLAIINVYIFFRMIFLLKIWPITRGNR